MAKHNKDVLTRKISCEMRAAVEPDGKHSIEGRAVVFNEHTLIADEWDEVILDGALDETDMRDVVLLINHDWNGVALARTKNGKGTMKLWAAEDGLHFRVEDLDVENNAQASALFSAVERGDMAGVSVAFVVRDDGDEWSWVRNATEAPYAYRVIKSIETIHEISIVNFPAYAGTSVVATRAEQESFNRTEETAKTEDALEMLRVRNENQLNMLV